MIDEWAREGLAPLRLLGMQCHSLTEGGQLPLYGQPQRERLQRLDRAMDQINRRFKDTPIQRARLRDHEG